MSGDVPVPVEVVERVDRYVSSELDDAERYENREPLDEAGVWSMHRLVADVYALGWAAGVHAEARRADARRQRERDAARRGVMGEGACGDLDSTTGRRCERGKDHPGRHLDVPDGEEW